MLTDNSVPDAEGHPLQCRHISRRLDQSAAPKYALLARNDGRVVKRSDVYSFVDATLDNVDPVDRRRLGRGDPNTQQSSQETDGCPRHVRCLTANSAPRLIATSAAFVIGNFIRTVERDQPPSLGKAT